MAKYQPYYQRFGKRNYVPSQILTVCVALLLLVGIAGLWHSTNFKFLQGKNLASIFGASVWGGSVSSAHLSDSDKILYKQIFTAQKIADWEAADNAISKLSSDILLPDVLADRYLNPNYNASAAEINVWLKNYPDHPQVPNMIELASVKNQELTLAYELPKIIKKPSLQGYGDANNNEIRFDSNTPAKKLWLYGLEAWRSGKKSESAKFFSSLADKQGGLSDWQSAAANFWAYRAHLAIGEQNKAAKYLAQAAANPRVFYGILARKQLGKPLELDTKPVVTDAASVASLHAKPEIQRIIALAEAGLNDKAESQIRSLFPSANKQEKWGLLALASELNLASAQISMAKQLDSTDRPLDALKYPVPQWQPDNGFSVEPNLIYALIRQESGFRTSAISPAGALGLMQLMPQTARMMHTSYIASNDDFVPSKKFNDPITNVTLGEHYVSRLLNNSLVDGNLFYMLAAYNAGIGRLKEWQDNIDYNNDPLLFVESIPYSETRGYVMQVMTNYWIYSELSGVHNKSIFAVLKNNWPSLPEVTPITADSGLRNKNG